MVKREKSPVIRDDAKYLLVHRPYPPNADFELPDDYREFAFWIAAILGSYKQVWGIHHKRKARSTVIVEVDREIDVNNLLGEHRWKDILKKPKKDEQPRVSQVFNSIYETTREARDDGWKRIQVEPDWFTERGWNLTDGPFKYPYPPSLWCPPLAEDPTGKPIARPLPASREPPPPPKTPLLVPGSVQWVEANSGSGGASASTPSCTPSSASGSTTQRGRDPAKDQKGAGKGQGVERGGRQGQPAHIQDPSAGFVQTPAAGNSNPWVRISTAPPPSLLGTGSPGTTSTRSPATLSYAGSVTASRTPTPSAFPPLSAPPGLSKRTNAAPLASPLTNTTRASSTLSSASPTLPEPLSSFTPTSARSPASVRSPSWADQVSLEVPLDPPGRGVLNLTRTRTAEEEETAALSLARLSLKTSGDEDEDGEGEYVPFDGDDDDDDDYGDVGYAGQAGSSWFAASSNGTAKLWSSAETSSQNAGGGAGSASGSGAVVDLWAADEGKTEESEPLCSVHGIKCTKGVCSEYRKLQAAKMRAAEAAERKENAAKRQRFREKRAGRGIRSISSRGKEPEDGEKEEKEDEDEGKEQEGGEKQEEALKTEEAKKADRRAARAWMHRSKAAQK